MKGGPRASGRGRLARGVGHWVERASAAVARAEASLAAFLILATCGLILLNIATRSMGDALYWVDEAAIYCMVWSAFLGASVTIRNRSAVAIDLLKDALGPSTSRALAALVQGAILVFGLWLLVLAWRWYDPLTMARLGFDVRAFSGETFNFIYREPTLTIGWPKWPIWLIMPLFGAAVSLHALANLLERTDDPWAPRIATGALD
jgi:TRAP-type C4-dicarboxylate transport system permease small subunit